MVLSRSSAFTPLFTLVLFGLVHAAVVKGQSIISLSSNQIASFTPFTHFASTAYCVPSMTINWSCGSNCDANPDFVPVASGGNDVEVKFWYVGFSPSQNTIIVAHQGEGSNDIEAELTDADFFLKSLDASLFPGIPSSVEVHNGFASTQALTATEILSAVKTTLSVHGASSVTVVGHSLGAALALLDGLYLILNLPNTGVRVIGYGMPRVGNQAFANWVDNHLALTHINNREDPIPILPGKFLGFHHASGEVHITDSGTWESCPGQDNPSELCTVGDVPNVFEGNLNDHEGPYNGIVIGC